MLKTLFQVWHFKLSNKKRKEIEGNTHVYREAMASHALFEEQIFEVYAYAFQG